MSDTQKNNLDDLFREIGAIAVVWAYLELTLDMCIRRIHKDWGMHKIRGLPGRQLARKLEYLRDCLKQDKFRTIFPNLEDIISTVEQASEHRHDLIHGVATGIHEFHLTGMTTLIRTIKETPEYATRRRATYKLENLRAFQKRVLRLAVFLGAFAEILSGEVGEDQPNKSLSKLLMELG